jgi:Domain of unknown function (DUF4034)
MDEDESKELPVGFGLIACGFVMENQRITKGIVVGWMLLAALGLCSCSPKQPKEKTESQKLDAQNARTRWRMATTVEEYERVGMKDPRWDADAKAALERFAIMDVTGSAETEQDLQKIGEFAGAAVEKGCKDPLVEYLYIKNGYDWRQHSNAENIKRYTAIGDAIAGSGYSEIRKFHGCLQMALRIFSLESENQDYYRLRHDSVDHLRAALEDKDLPEGEAALACRMLLEATQNNTYEFQLSYETMEKPLFKNFSKTSVPYVSKGYYNIELAWRARGGGYSDSVSKEGWKKFAEHMAIAAEALEQGWKIDPSDARIPTLMLRVEEGQGQGKERMEMWFQRAMKADPNNLEACKNKLHYLYPQWYGSYGEMIAFGRECLTNQNWGGYVTAFLVDAHQAVADWCGEGTNYWKRPEVWTDIHAAFEEYYRRYPEDTDPRYNYTWYANACGHPEVVAKQLQSLKEPINYDYFGGKEAFEAMKARALEAAKMAATPAKAETQAKRE